MYSDRGRRAAGRVHRRLLCIDDPVDAAHVRDEVAEARGIGKIDKVAEEVQVAGVIGFLQTFEEQTAEEICERPNGWESSAARRSACSVGRQAPAGSDAMHVWMMRGSGPRCVGPRRRRSGRRSLRGLAATVVIASADAANRIASGEWSMNSVPRAGLNAVPLKSSAQAVGAGSCGRADC